MEIIRRIRQWLHIHRWHISLGSPMRKMRGLWMEIEKTDEGYVWHILKSDEGLAIPVSTGSKWWERACQTEREAKREAERFVRTYRESR